MAITSGTGSIASIRPVQNYSVGASPSARPHNTGDGPEGCYDKLAISQEASEGSHRFQMELVSRLSQEVRAAVTTGDIQQIKKQISSGEYRADASEIAARMLLLGDEN